MSAKVSVCLTVFNEAGTIEELLESLCNQTRKPDQIVVCDGKSKDGTIEIIKQLQKKHGKKIRLVISPGPVAHGRNIAIKYAKHPIIASIDAGCIAMKDWLEELIAPFKDSNVDIVAGFYEMKWKTPFQKIMALYRGTPPSRYDKNTFIPSCRSVAFKKSVWGEVGGFNESLALSGEDTQFFYRAMRNGEKIVRVKNALVEWKEPEQFGFKDFKKFFYYARGDAQTGIWWDPVKKWRTHNIKIFSIFVRYIFLIGGAVGVNWISLKGTPKPAYAGMTTVLFIVFCLLFYASWSILKWRDVVREWHHQLWIPVVQVGTDLMVMAGFLAGIVVSE